MDLGQFLNKKFTKNTRSFHYNSIYMKKLILFIFFSVSGHSALALSDSMLEAAIKNNPKGALQPEYFKKGVAIITDRNGAMLTIRAPSYERARDIYQNFLDQSKTGLPRTEKTWSQGNESVTYRPPVNLNAQGQPFNHSSNIPKN
jgi:hypothetical protein